MAVRKIKKSWWIDLRFDHTRYRKRSPENSKAGAAAYEAVLRQKLARGEDIERKADALETFESFAWKWFDEYVIPNNKYSEQRNKKYILTASLIPFFGKMPVAEITTHRIEQFRAQQMKRPVGNKTINNRVTVLNKCLVTAHEWLELKTPVPKTQPLKCPPLETNYLLEEECELLLANAEGIVHEMVLVSLRTGMRQGEIKGLQWSSIDWKNQSLAVRHSRCDYRKELGSPKSNRERHIPLNADVYEMLLKRRRATGYVFLNADGEPFTHKSVTSELARVCEKAKLRRITWHILRHTFASHLAEKGVPLGAIQMLLGHSAISTTMRYAHVAPSTLRTAIGLLSPGAAVPMNFGQPVGNPWLALQQRKQETKS